MQDIDSPDNEGSAEDKPKPAQLLAMELRVLGVLMEKQLTTPDQYPLTINSIVTACNQKSSRDPITHYHQGEVQRCLRELEERNFVRKEYGSRTDKYTQHFMAHLELGKKQQAILCIMMLRGPQTISELHTRTQRMEVFSDKDELNHCVDRLCEREIPYAMHLGTPGQRGARVAHLFSGIPEFSAPAPATARSAVMSEADTHTLAQLERDVAQLKETVQTLERENSTLKDQIETLYLLTDQDLPPTPVVD